MRKCASAKKRKICCCSSRNATLELRWWEQKKEREKIFIPFNYLHTKKRVGKCQMTFQQAMNTLQSWSISRPLFFRLSSPFLLHCRLERHEGCVSLTRKSLCFSRFDLNESIVVCSWRVCQRQRRQRRCWWARHLKTPCYITTRMKGQSPWDCLHFEYLNLLTNPPSSSDRWDAIQIILIMISSVILTFFLLLRT